LPVDYEVNTTATLGRTKKRKWRSSLQISTGASPLAKWYEASIQYNPFCYNGSFKDEIKQLVINKFAISLRNSKENFSAKICLLHTCMTWYFKQMSLERTVMAYISGIVGAKPFEKLLHYAEKIALIDLLLKF